MSGGRTVWAAGAAVLLAATATAAAIASSPPCPAALPEPAAFAAP